MRMVLQLIISLALWSTALPVGAQQDVHVFTSERIRLVKDGERANFEAGDPYRIVLNLRDSTITIFCPEEQVKGFLNYQGQFQIVDLLGSNGNAQYFITASDFVIAFEYNMRAVIVRKRGVNVRMNSLWFDQFDYKN